MINEKNHLRGNLDMRNKFKAIVGVLLFAFSTLVSAERAQSVEANVSFGGEQVHAQIGDVFTTDVLMSNFPVTEGGGLVLHYDPKYLQVSNVTVDSSVWQFVNKNGDIDNAAGTVTGILFSSYRGVAGSAKIATIEFQATKKGKTEIILEESADNPFASNGQKIGVVFTPTKVRIRR